MRYYNMWRNLSTMPFSELGDYIQTSGVEAGFASCVWLFSQFLSHPQWMFVLSGLFFVFSVCLFIYRNSEHVLISLIVFITWGLFTFMIQGMRQATAMCICLFAIESVKKRKIVPFILQILIAFCFHNSAIVFAIMYFIPWKKFSFINKIQMSIVSLGIILCGNLLMAFGNQLLDSYYELSVQRGGYVAIILYAILIIGSVLFVKHSVRVPSRDYRVVLLYTEKQRREETLFIAMTILGAVFMIMRYTCVQAMERISFYFQFGQMIVLPMIFQRFDKQSRNTVYAFAIVLSILLFMYRVQASGLVPYEFFWQGTV